MIRVCQSDMTHPFSFYILFSRESIFFRGFFAGSTIKLCTFIRINTAIIANQIRMNAEQSLLKPYYVFLIYESC